MSQDSLFRVLGAMLNELRDDHTNLISPFNVSVYQVDLTGADNYEERTIRENYLKNDMYITGGFTHGFIANRTVGYVRYSSFMNGVSDADLDFILKRYQNAKGLILDLRENGGGSIINVPMILNRFVSQKTLVGYERTRNGVGRNDFSKDEEFYLVPSDYVQYTKPVMVLIDRCSYSATTFFALATKALPNVTLIGDTTGGGGGLPNGGQLPNGWTYRFSITQLLDLNKNNYAEAGVPADIPAQLNLTDRTSDAIIERAILALQ
jgi:C-terminal processing protease CtpA/Prc